MEIWTACVLPAVTPPRNPGTGLMEVAALPTYQQWLKVT